MKKNADQINFKVTPEVLEAHASEVDLAIDARFPAKYFDKKATLTATPVIKYEGGETKYQPVTVQGEKVEANMYFVREGQVPSNSVVKHEYRRNYR
ncbi:MAG: hypothetical protein R3182_02700 [Draconibacterium sp.]|nr:hypothetical protein [Draconibacterium sp.]